MAASEATIADFFDKLEKQEFRCYYSGLRLDPCTVSPERLDETCTYVLSNWVLIHRAFQSSQQWSRTKVEQVPALRSAPRIISDEDILAVRRWHVYQENFQAQCDGGVYGQSMLDPTSTPTWYPTLTAAAEAVDGYVSDVSKACKRVYAQHKGYRWWYKNELIGERPRFTSLSEKIQQSVVNAASHTVARNVRRKKMGKPLLSAPNVTVGHILDLLDAQKGRCAYLGVPLRVESGDWMMSLERVDEDVGYVTGNVVIACIETNVGSFHWSREFADVVWPRA